MLRTCGRTRADRAGGAAALSTDLRSSRAEHSLTAQRIVALSARVERGEQEAMTRSVVTERAARPERAPAVRIDRRRPAVDLVVQLQRTAGNRATSTLLAAAAARRRVERQPAEAMAEPAAAEAAQASGRVLVGDDHTPSSGQIRHAEMLAALRARVLGIADEVLGRVGQE